MKLLLLAVELKNENGVGTHLTINPGSNVKIEIGTRGFFIAGSSDETKRFNKISLVDIKDFFTITKII